MATITGTAGQDNLTGTSGSDVIDGAGGIDTIDAGAGDDVVMVGGTLPYLNHLYSMIDGGAGYDVLDFSRWDHKLVIGTDLSGRIAADEEFGWQGDDYLYTTVADTHGFEEIRIGPQGAEVNLQAPTTGDPDSLRGWKVVADTGNDYIADARGNDTIDSGGGEDTVSYSGGDDRVTLGDGADNYHVVHLSGFVEHAIVDGGGGSDTLIWTDLAMAEGLVVDLAAGTAHASAMDLTFNGFENVTLEGKFGYTVPYWSLSIAGDDAANDLRGVAVDGRSVVISGRGGDDHISMGYGGDDPNFVNATATIYGGAGNDNIIGSDASDWINGGGRADGDPFSPTEVNDGSDSIFGNGGNDHIFGNAQLAVQGAADGGDYIDGGFGMDYVNGNAGNDTIHGSLGPDRLYGGAGDDRVFGEDDNDHLNGNKGDDTLRGGQGNDEILGGQGDDLIEGGSGLDTLSGNLGRDIFQFSGDAANFTASGMTDVITDFQHGQDYIQDSTQVENLLHVGSAADFAGALALAHAALPMAGIWTEDAAAVQVGADTYLFWGEGADGPEAAVRLIGVTASTISLDDFAYSYANWG